MKTAIVEKVVYNTFWEKPRLAIQRPFIFLTAVVSFLSFSPALKVSDLESTKPTQSSASIGALLTSIVLYATS